MNINGFEIERKFLIKYPDINKLLDNPLCRVLKMEQFYLQGGGRVIEEEGLASDSDLVYLLSVQGHCAVISHFHSRHLLQQVLQHCILTDPE